MPGDATRREGRAGGPLTGLTFAVKDLFDVSGTIAGCGSPDWAAAQRAADRSAWAVGPPRAPGGRPAGHPQTAPQNAGQPAGS